MQKQNDTGTRRHSESAYTAYIHQVDFFTAFI